MPFFDGGAAIDNFFAQLAGDGSVDLSALSSDLGGVAAGLVFGGNPLYTLTDFVAIYPKFLGVPVDVSGTLTSGSAIVSCAPPDSAAVGQLVTGTGIPAGTTIASTASDSITISANATADGEQALKVYSSPVVPTLVLQMYLNLASASLMQDRWQDMWPMAMALYVAHFATLYLRSEGNIGSTPGQIAASGLEKGIQISKSAGGVGVGAQLPDGLGAWGTWAETTYGSQLATFARCIGAGPIFVR